MATRTTTGAGNWSDPTKWDTGVPTVDDDAVVDHNMTIDADITFANLDNNATLTKDANARVVTVKGGGAIDNAGGTISCSNNGNITFKSSNTTKWTWTLDSGTWTDGNDEHHFENGRLTVANNYTLFNSGTYHFDQDMQFDSSAASKYLRIDVASSFAAGKTFTLGNGVNSGFYLFPIKDITAEGTSVNGIIFDGNTKTGHLNLYNNNAMTASVKYCTFRNGAFGLRLQYWTGGSGTFENITAHGNNTAGVFCDDIRTGNTITMKNVTSYSNTTYGVYKAGLGKLILIEPVLYSNTLSGFLLGSTANAEGLELQRLKSYSNTQNGVHVTNVAKANQYLMYSSLVYENGYDGVYWGTPHEDDYIFNSTIADNGAAHSNIYQQSAANDLAITNTICYGAKYGIRGSTVDPTVTYCNVYGATTANYQDMADPTGSDGNISKDPKFTDAAADDYSLKSSSPCINKGTGVGAPANDIDNVAWPNAKPEMGCYGKLLTGWTHKINGVESANLGKVNSVEKVSIAFVNQT